MPAPANRPARQRVAVTGLGVKTPAGCDLKTFADTMFAGTPTARRVTEFDTTGINSKIACLVSDFDPSPYASPKMLRRMDRFTQLGLAAAMDAYTDAGSPAAEPERAGVSAGTATGGLRTAIENAEAAAERGAEAVSGLLVSMLMPNAAAAYISLVLGWHGPNTTCATTCASGTDAINNGAKMIRDGEADIVLAGAAEAAGATPLIMAAFAASGALSTRNDDPATASRPFDSDRDGYVMGEGAAYLLLERYDLAVARNATIYGEIAGGSRSADGYHVSAPHPEGRGAAACMRAAIADAGLTPADIRQINCHATATVLGDVAEASAVLTVFGDAPPPVTGPKGVLGHLIGASGAAEAVVAVLSARQGVVPPTAGHFQLAADCAGLDVVSGTPRKVGVGPVLSNSFGVGGQNASVIIIPPAEETL